MNHSKSIFVIIPCYNEAKVVRQTVTEVLEKGYSIVVVDDCSKDGSKKQLAGLPVYYLRHRVNMGQGAALQTGIEFAKRKGAKYFVTFDADGQHDKQGYTANDRILRERKCGYCFWLQVFTGGANQCVTFKKPCLEFWAVY